MKVDNVGSLVGGAVQIGRSGGAAAEAAVAVATNAPAPAPAVPAGKLSAEDLARLSADLQQKADLVAPQIRFTVDQSNGRTLIEVTDRETNKVIRQIPSEEAVQIAKNIGEFQRHLLLDQEA
jgi:flagellar protein FlaG